MVEKLICEECGTELPANAPQGLCPKCLAGMGLQLARADSPAPRSASAIDDPKYNIQNPTVHYFGDYELLEEIARGGMGIVYRARQVSLNRIVAVKMLLFGKFSSDEFVQRFRTEAEAAASLQHPNIVAIHEVGEHDGQQYFSMDYIEGQSLNQLIADCGVRNADLKKLVVHVKTVAEAIHYAHQHGVLHRDLKPSNVLIDRDGQPYITDFGLAKRFDSSRSDSASGHPLSSSDEWEEQGEGSSPSQPASRDGAHLTATGQMLGSPNYMPPEQASRKRGPVGTRSDVYSLGAILYHLVTGRPPFLAETVEETLLQLLNTEPVSPRLLNPSVPRDLETICLKCLNKEPRARYVSAATLAADLDCWLVGRPISARPAGVPEKLWRWCRRQPALASLIAAIVVLLVTVAMGSTWMFVRETQARAHEAKLRLQAQAAEKKANTEARKSQQIARLLEHILESVGPSVPLGSDTTLRRKILEIASEHIGKDFTNQPQVEVELRATMARVYHELGLYQPMEQMARETLRLSRSSLGEQDPAVPHALSLLGDALMHLGKLEEAENVSRQALEMQKKLAGNAHPELANFLGTLGVVLQREGKLAQAESLFRQALELKRNLLGYEHPEVAGLLENVALVLRDQGRLAEAEAMQREVLAMRKRLLGDENEDVATSLHNLARVLYDQGRLDLSESMYADALAMRRRFLGNEHPAVATTLHNLALVLQGQDRLADAERMHREALAMRRKLLGEEHPAVATSFNDLASVLRDQGKLAEAESMVGEALMMRRKLLGDGHPDVATSLRDSIDILRRQGKFDEAKALLEGGPKTGNETK